MQPHPEQQTILRGWNHKQAPAQFIAISGAIQSGKSWVTALRVFLRHPWWQLVWFLGNRYEDTRHEMTYLREWLAQLDLLDGKPHMPDSGDHWIIRSAFGCTFESFSGQVPATISGEAPNALIECEAGQLSWEAHQTAMARTVPRGAEMLLVGTPEKTGPWFRDLFARWQEPNQEGAIAFPLPAWSNRHFYPQGAADPKIVRAQQLVKLGLMDARTYRHRIEGLPAPPENLVFPEFDPAVHCRPIYMEGGLLELELQPDGAWLEPSKQDPRAIWLPPDTPLEVWIDPGQYPSSYAVLAVAVLGGHVYVLDELYEQRTSDKAMVQLAHRRWWWRHVRQGVADRASRAHHGSASAYEVWTGAASQGGGGISVATEREVLRIEDGESRLRDLLRPDWTTGVPGLIIGPRCRATRKEFTEGYVFNSYGQRQDKRNHAIKAISYGVYARFGALEPAATDGPGYGVRTPQRKRPWANILPFTARVS